MSPKIVISRKGFDASSGGGPSPVLPDGTMVSFPIPEPAGNLGGGTNYFDITAGRHRMSELLATLAVDPTLANASAHLDPDLDQNARPRLAGWRPSFGQANAAAGHLANQGVTAGDLFVFWGLFRHVISVGSALRWDSRRPAFHAVFGWLEIGQVLDPRNDHIPEWASEHPHVRVSDRANNTLYVAATSSSRPGGPSGLLRWNSRRRLSCPSGPRSRWQLPLDLHPSRTGATLSYHGDPKRWEDNGVSCILNTVGRGQEFVVRATPEWQAWTEDVLSDPQVVDSTQPKA
jgi:hypothetical protein